MRIIFITGTDTGVGKTLLTGLLLQHLRHKGCHARAMKPFASGSWADTQLLWALQDRELALHEITPFYTAKPIAPLAAARRYGRTPRLSEVVASIRHTAGRCECLLIEGIGGLYVPLGHGFTVKDLIARLACEVIVVARNSLGTINHILLTVAALQRTEISGLTTVLMGQRGPDASTASNPRILGDLLAPSPVHSVGYLGPNALRLGVLKKSEKKCKKTLARILAPGIVRPLRSL